MSAPRAAASVAVVQPIMMIHSTTTVRMPMGTEDTATSQRILLQGTLRSSLGSGGPSSGLIRQAPKI